MANDHETSTAIPPRSYAKYSDGSRVLTLREVQQALSAVARLALFAQGRIQLDHDEVEAYMDEVFNLMEVAHDASPKVK